MTLIAAGAVAAAVCLAVAATTSPRLLVDPAPEGGGAPVQLRPSTVGVVVGALLGTALFGPIAGFAVLLAAVSTRRVRALRRRTSDAGRVVEQVPDAVAAIAAGMRAGLSLTQSIAYSAGELEPPLSSELRELVERVEMGMSLDRSIERWSDDGGPEVRLTCSVLQLHRRTGGELPQVLERVANMLEQRREAEREARSLTAQARLSGAILGLLPIGFFGFMFLLSPGEMSQVVTSPAGMLAIAVGFGMQGLAFMWIRSLLRVER